MIDNRLIIIPENISAQFPQSKEIQLYLFIINLHPILLIFIQARPYFICPSIDF
jgi:hypothetical protein